VLHEVQRRHKRISAYLVASSAYEACGLLEELGPSARVIAGGSDLLLELDRGDRTGVHTLVDVSALPGAAAISEDSGRVWLGSGVTHAQVVQSELCRSALTPLAQACLEVGAPQLRNTATVVGNVVTASPANDTLSALSALDTVVELLSPSGRRTVPLAEFVTGYRSVDLRPAELVSRLGVRPLEPDETAMFAKSGLRRAQAISVVHLAVRLRRDSLKSGISDLVVAVGSIGPTVEAFDDLAGLASEEGLSEAAMDEIASAAAARVNPMDDLRATAQYRKTVLRVMLRRVLHCLASGDPLAAWPAQPPTLAVAGSHWRPHTGRRGDGQAQRDDPAAQGRRTGSRLRAEPHPGPAALPGGGSGSAGGVGSGAPLTMTVNGAACSGPRDANATLLDWLRDHAGTLGVKEGCAEGECGACTVVCNGKAVLACLVAAPRMAGAEVLTVEGLASPSSLSPVQQAFVDCGAVQCGFCTPGFVMSVTALLSEVPRPSAEQVRDALAGNLCRCTGYDSILRAVQAAAASASRQSAPEDARGDAQAGAGQAAAGGQAAPRPEAPGT